MTTRRNNSITANVSVDFVAVNDAALRALPALLRRWLPDGRVVGAEYVAKNPTRGDKRAGSFKVRLSGQRAGAWADFATSDRGGNVVSLTAFLHNLSQPDAARYLAMMLGVSHD